MTTLILGSVIIIGVFGYLFYMKKSGKLGAFQQNYIEAEADANANFDTYLQNFKNDPETFKPIVDIIGSDFISLANCKKPKSILGAIGDTAKTMATNLVLIDSNISTLVLTNEKLHYIEYNTSSKKSEEHWVFEKSNIKNLKFEKGKLTDNLKQSMSFELASGGKSGDSVDNNEMRKLTFTSNDKKYEFFIYEIAGFGKGFVPENPIGGLSMNQTKDDILKSMYLPMKIADKFFENIVKFSS